MAAPRALRSTSIFRPGSPGTKKKQFEMGRAWKGSVMMVGAFVGAYVGYYDQQKYIEECRGQALVNERGAQRLEQRSRRRNQ